MLDKKGSGSSALSTFYTGSLSRGSDDSGSGGEADVVAIGSSSDVGWKSSFLSGRAMRYVLAS